jgi:DNA repair exonuclease SbcCD ATPase subunit
LPEEPNKLDELKDKAIETAAEAAEDLVEELVEDLTDGKDNSDNPWYRRWWNSWTKGVSVLAIIGGLGTWGMQMGIEWYKERKDREYERIESVEKQLTELNKQLAVMNQAQKDMVEDRREERSSKEVMWRSLRDNDERMHNMNTQMRINAILLERNAQDIRSNHSSKGYCNHDSPKESKDKKASLEDEKDVEKLTAFEKWRKKALGTPEEKKIIEAYEKAEEEQRQINKYLEDLKKPKKDDKPLKDYIEQKQDQLRQEQQQRKK